jgi:hypothetical protein
MTVHELKTWPEFFDAVESGDKPFEVRRCGDRSFTVGDVLVLQEYDPRTETYTGRECAREVTYVLVGQPFLPDGLAVMGLKVSIDACNVIRDRIDRGWRQRSSLLRGEEGMHSP